MCRLLLCLFIAGLGTLSGAEEPAPAGKPARAPHPSFAPVAEVAGKPRVLIIGDSISMGYTLDVRAILSGRANVLRPAENCGDTARGISRIEQWLGPSRWDVIVFNFGLHDLKYLDEQRRYVNPPAGRQVASPERYAENLTQLVHRLKRTGATLLFANTTPVPVGTTGRVAGEEKIFNEAARRVMAAAQIEIIDLHATVTAGDPGWQRPRDVHFTEAGSTALAHVVAAAIDRALASRLEPAR